MLVQVDSTVQEELELGLGYRVVWGIVSYTLESWSADSSGQ